jgi:hypothetical protein
MPNHEQVSWLDWMMAEPKEVSASSSASRNQWRALVDEICPPGAKLIWDSAEGRLVVRRPKPRWK